MTLSRANHGASSDLARWVHALMLVAVCAIVGHAQDAPSRSDTSKESRSCAVCGNWHLNPFGDKCSCDTPKDTPKEIEQSVVTAELLPADPSPPRPVVVALGQTSPQRASVARTEYTEWDYVDEEVLVMEPAPSSILDPYLPRSNLALPWLRESAEARGFTLPLPLGTSIIFTELDRTVAVSDIRVGLGGNPPQSVSGFQVSNLKADASSQIGRLDLWLFPFLNVYGVLGQTNSRGQITATVNEFPLSTSPAFSFPIDISLEGPTYGGGGTFALGTKDFFGSLDVNYTQTDFTSLDSGLTALVIAPRFGVIINKPSFKGAFHIGAMYQETTQTVDVILNQPTLGPIHVSVDQFEPDKWNYLTGMIWGIDERLQAMIEFGTGGRSYLISGVTVRF